ncbi:hypothetical protein TNCV_3619011 [Trichonephila clavipes]|nr:hypothetical protein TNCV_3619011 [Trichonephila clavipes]
MSSNFVILHGNTWFPVAKVYIESLSRKKCEVLEHLTQSRSVTFGYHIFRLLKIRLMGQQFPFGNDVMAAVLNRLLDQPISFFADVIRYLPKQ